MFCLIKSKTAKRSTQRRTRERREEKRDTRTDIEKKRRTKPTEENFSLSFKTKLRKSYDAAVDGGSEDVLSFKFDSIGVDKSCFCLLNNARRIAAKSRDDGEVVETD